MKTLIIVITLLSEPSQTAMTLRDVEQCPPPEQLQAYARQIRVTAAEAGYRVKVKASCGQYRPPVRF